MQTNYYVQIRALGDYHIHEGVPTNFIVTVTEPSALANFDRSATFSTTKLSPLNNPVFNNFANFPKRIFDIAPEAVEVDALVWYCLGQAQITPKQVTVKVSFMKTFLIGERVREIAKPNYIMEVKKVDIETQIATCSWTPDRSKPDNKIEKDFSFDEIEHNEKYLPFMA